MLLTDINSYIVYFSEWIKDFACYDTIVEKLNKHRIKYDLLPHTRDYWVRDFMPIQISDSEFIQYKYNPNYLQKEHHYITNPDKACNYLGISTKKIDIVLDGGNIVKCSDCIIMTDKVFSENNHLSKIQLINILEDFFQYEIIFIPWDRYEKYGHADGMVRFIDNGKILLNNYTNFDKSLRSQIINVLQNKFEIIELEYSVPKLSSHSWAYINYLQVGRFILLPALGIPEDRQAYEQFSTIFSDYQIEQVNITEIVKLGGALNCMSWNIKC
ncbi:agmatine deiminase family protein [Dysgonomonas capnocytophagoides]|uniref:agmatine deiminase family protein n=1 Tax=Dysgonomonas capnocytophagoides TaxID=45254 RepID=UPI00334053A9